MLVLQETSLWWAGKVMILDKLLKDHIGSNEKTKVVVKLQSAAAGVCELLIFIPFVQVLQFVKVV